MNTRGPYGKPTPEQIERKLQMERNLDRQVARQNAERMARQRERNQAFPEDGRKVNRGLPIKKR